VARGGRGARLSRKLRAPRACLAPALPA
jgi:hypothetical protein